MWRKIRARYNIKWLIVIIIICVITIFKATQTDYEDDFDWTNLPDKELTDETSSSGIGACIYPKLKLWPNGLKEYFKKQPAPNCAAKHTPLVSIENGEISLISGVSDDLYCDYVPAYWGDHEAHIRLGDPIHIHPDHPQPLISHSGYVTCSWGWWPLSWFTRQNDLFVRHPATKIAPKPALDDIAKEDKLNVFLLGFDSTSNKAWLRNLPLTHEYFIKELGGVDLDTFNIVADGTTGNILGILSGAKESELYETRKGTEGSRYVDDFPWFWKDFHNAGYVTQLYEDDPTTGMFTYRLNGFKESPVHHNGKPVYKLAQQLGLYSSRRAMCMGSKSKISHSLGFLQDFLDNYRDQPKAFFNWMAEYSHDSPYQLNAVDEDMLKFLKKIKGQGHLDNTLLIMHSDHGSRYGVTRKFMQGRYEERLPYLGIALPKKWKQAHPEAAESLMKNRQKLVTSFDLHATITDILQGGKQPYGKVKTKYGMSLLGNLPANRSCSECGIDPHWCVCLEWNVVNTKSPSVIEAAQNTVDAINDKLAPQKQLCAKLEVSQISKAYVYTANKKLLMFHKSVIEDNRDFPIFTPVADTQIRYFLLFHTSPSNGIFEASLGYDSKTQKYDINVDTISRINAYGSQPSCLNGNFPRLDKFCYCK